MANKAERIAYYIEKECCKFSLTEWCADRDMTLEEFHAFILAGEKHFEEELNNGK